MTTRSRPTDRPTAQSFTGACDDVRRAAQTDLFALDEVRAALSALGSTATWLESGEEVSALPIDDNDARVRAAVQTMRLLPRRDVALVAIGGILAGAPKPFVLRAITACRREALASASTTSLCSWRPRL